jgi:RNA polymerase sigma-70 factor (ECF subfamily)
MEIVAVVSDTPSELGALLDRVAAHDRESFTRLVTMFDADLLRLAFAVSGDSELAQDAVQTAWERLWQRPPTMRDTNRIRSWLLSVAANEARRVAKRRRRGQILEAKQASPMRASDPSTGVETLDLHAAIQRLSAADRELLALRYVLDMPSPEIARHLNLSPEGVRTRLRRAVSKLREEMNHARRT